MRILVVPILFLAVTACGRLGEGAQARHAESLDAFLVARAQELLPQLDALSGGGGGGSSDGAYRAQYDRRLRTRGPLGAETHATLLGTLATDTEAWLVARGLRLPARGMTGDAEGPVERFDFRYESDDTVGWVFANVVRNEDGGLTLLIQIAEHVD